MERAGASAEYFDRWYADLADAAPREAIVRRHLGLPAGFLSTSLLGWAGIAEVVAALRLPAGGTLVDLACGRGGYGLEIAGRAHARLVGVDFSTEAIRLAGRYAAGAGRHAEFRVGELTATGLADASADGVVCIDAIQFADDPLAAYGEIRRILRPGGRVVLTCWEALDTADGRLPQRLRAVDAGAGLRAAGFADVDVVDRPRWLEAEHALWQEAAALDPGEDPALRSLRDEGVRVLATAGLTRRVLARATAPG